MIEQELQRSKLATNLRMRTTEIIGATNVHMFESPSQKYELLSAVAVVRRPQTTDY